MMIVFSWVVRLLLLVIVLPFLIPFGILFGLIIASPLSFAVFVLILALLVLGVLLGVALGVVGNLIDLVIVLALIGILWHWPRATGGRFVDKLRISSRRLRDVLRIQLRRFTTADLVICLLLILVAVILSLSSGLVHFLLTIFVTLLIIGIVWKWPRSSHLPLAAKLRIALVSLREELRRLFH